MERYSEDWGDFHCAYLYAKISDKITLKDVDQRVLELVSKHVEDSKDEKEKAQRILMFQIIGEACDKENYEYTKENGYLGEASIAIVLRSNKQTVEVPHDFPFTHPKKGIHTKVITKFGYLRKIDDNKYCLVREKGETIGAGFYLEVWNHYQPNITKEDCENMLDRVVDVIKKYSKFVEIIHKNSL